MRLLRLPHWCDVYRTTRQDMWRTPRMNRQNGGQAAELSLKRLALAAAPPEPAGVASSLWAGAPAAHHLAPCLPPSPPHLQACLSAAPPPPPYLPAWVRPGSQPASRPQDGPSKPFDTFPPSAHRHTGGWEASFPSIKHWRWTVILNSWTDATFGVGVMAGKHDKRGTSAS